MNRRLLSAAGAVIATVVLMACEVSKSSTPLSATIAGPLPGVNISAPKMLEPGANARIAVDKQPLTLLIENASTTGVRPLSYAFDVATDATFNSVVFARDGIAPGDGGRTSLRLSDSLAPGRTYFWRARAEDGANSSPYAAAAGFEVFTPIVIESPVQTSPARNVTVDSVRPKFTVTNARRSGPVGAMVYLIEVADSDSFSTKIATWSTGEQANQTVLELAADLAYNKVYYWHVRAYDPTTIGPWSLTSAFATPATPAVAPPGGPSPPNGGDGFDLRTVVIVKGPGNIAGWPVGSTITSVDQSGGQLCINHEQLGRWPSVPFFGDAATLVEGNQWVFMQKSGQWFGGAADWYRPGQACKAVDAQSIGRDAFYNSNEEPLHSWVPQPGELFGVMDTTPARAWPDMRTLDQRTNVVLLRWR